MNGDSYRGAQPSGGRVINRPTGSSYHATDEQPRGAAFGGGQSAASNGQPRRKGKKDGQIGKRFLMMLLVIGLIGAIALGGWFAWDKFQNKATAINTSEYQAVFLTNGQFYFGKLDMLNNDYLKLTNVYYMQGDSAKGGASTTEEASSADNNYKLIKLGSEIHGPEDAMMISKDQVLYYENLKPDGEVMRVIKQDSVK